MKYPVSDLSAKLHNGKFTDADPALGIESSIDKAAWLNMIFDELIAVVVGGGQVPSETVFNQVLAAINNLIALAIATRSPLNHGHLWSQLSGIPATFPPSVHNQDWNTLTGEPIAPTQAQSDNSTRIATTAFVKAATAALINSSPAALDTLSELATALGNDPNFRTTMLNLLASKPSGAGIAFNWAGRGGQPTWMFGGEVANDIGVYNPANFNVNHANSAGNANTVGGYSAADILNACLPNLQGGNTGQRGCLIPIATGGAVVLPAGGTWFHYVIGFWPSGSGREGMIGFSSGGAALNTGGNGMNYGWAIKVA